MLCVPLMQYQHCPLCTRIGRLLPDICKHFSTVDYYRCDICAHVWCYSKHDPESPRIDITSQKQQPRKAPSQRFFAAFFFALALVTGAISYA